MTAIDFIKQHPEVKEWDLRAHSYSKGWFAITLLDIVHETYGKGMYLCYVDENQKGKLWVE